MNPFHYFDDHIQPAMDRHPLIASAAFILLCGFIGAIPV